MNELDTVIIRWMYGITWCRTGIIDVVYKCQWTVHLLVRQNSIKIKLLVKWNVLV